VRRKTKSGSNISFFFLFCCVGFDCVSDAMTDGCGEIPVAFMKQIAAQAGLNYIPSAVQIRVASPFIAPLYLCI
jgi:hypothetical protein